MEAVTAARINPHPLPRYRSSSDLLQHMQTSDSEIFEDADAVVAEFDKVADKESDFDDNLARALLFWGLMTPELGRDWYDSTFGDPRVLLDCLRAVDLVTPDVGVEWYVERFRNEELRIALNDAGLLKGCSREWIADHFKRPEDMISCLRDAGLLTAEPGVEWYADKIGRRPSGRPMYSALGWRDWLDIALFEAGLRDSIPEGSVRWYAASLKGEALLDAITEAGLLKEVGLAWLCARLGRSSKLTVKAMRASGMWDKKSPKVVMRCLDGEALEEYMQDKGLDEHDLEDATRNCTSSYWVRGTDGGRGGED